MTISTNETRLIGTGTGLLPRVNLLPPEIAERRVFQQVQVGLGAAVLAAVGVVALLYVGATHSVTSANNELVAAQTQNTALTAEAAKYRNVTALYAAAAAAQAQLTTAMGDEVRYSQLLNDLSLSVPSNVWIKSLTFAQTPGAAGAPSIGTFTVNGIGFSHDDVAVWLESVSGLRSYANPYFANSTESLLGKKPIVTFTSTANVTPKALSNRYNKPVGS